jgi:hypothetical protein
MPGFRPGKSKDRWSKLFAAAKKIVDGIDETFTYMGFPS